MSAPPARGGGPDHRDGYFAGRAAPLGRVPAEVVHAVFYNFADAPAWHAATLLREHRGDGHNAALVAAGTGGIEARVLHALSESIPAEKFGRVHHLAADGSVTPTGRPRSGSSGSPTTSPHRRTPAWSRVNSTSWAGCCHRLPHSCWMSAVALARMRLRWPGAATRYTW